MARRFSSSPPSVQRYFAFLTLVVVAAVVSLAIYVVSEHKLLNTLGPDSVQQIQNILPKKSVFLEKIDQAVANPNTNATQKISDQGLQDIVGESARSDRTNKTSAIAEKMEMKKEDDAQHSESDQPLQLNYDVHLFYYPWYGDPATDGKYLHWNHRYLPHWRKEEAVKWPSGVHVPPDDISANFYPALGPYSSGDPVVVDKHMKQIQSSGAGEMMVSLCGTSLQEVVGFCRSKFAYELVYGARWC